jgi:pimeloyl-ACP methyl ester carboxylesterase
MSKLLILFVHGLGGGEGTWGSFERLLKADGEIKGRITVEEFVFPTRLVRWLPTWRSTSLQDLAKALATEIRTKYQSYPKILMVCHSLGGLVAKRFIIETLKLSMALQVREVIFFATPHLGAGIATWADYFSFKHRHLRQLQKDSDFIELINEDWATIKCEAHVGATYVVGGQDAVVSRQSAAAIPGAKVEVIADKGHVDIVKPKSRSDVSFLLVQQAARRLLTDRGDDLAELKKAVEQRDSTKVIGLVVNRGRSWIETSEADEAISLFKKIESTFDPGSIEVVWTQYLAAIALLFRDRSAPVSTFDHSFLERARAHGLEPLVLAERMEFARKRKDASVLSMAAELEAHIATTAVASSPNNAYALGVAFFLLGNLLRAGGRYADASVAIARARAFYRPPILSHQIELAHCHYALAVCRAMIGGSLGEDVQPITIGTEFRRFADALSTLARSHSAWAKNEVGEAIEQAERASLVFQQIRFVAYSQKAQTLAALLGAWQRLELGAKSDQLPAHVGEADFGLQGILGDNQEIGRLKKWIQEARPSRVVGLLQFSSAYNPDWTRDIGPFGLPPILSTDSGGQRSWKRETCNSLAQADATLRSLMGITHDARLPLLAD